MSAKAEPVRTVYRGFPVVVDSADIMVQTPDGKDLAFFESMVGVRRWVRRKRKELGLPGRG
jgi:hypothetical protein